VTNRRWYSASDLGIGRRQHHLDEADRRPKGRTPRERIDGRQEMIGPRSSKTAPLAAVARQRRRIGAPPLPGTSDAETAIVMTYAPSDAVVPVNQRRAGKLGSMCRQHQSDSQRVHGFVQARSADSKLQQTC
jgi:hypothetical protein